MFAVFFATRLRLWDGDEDYSSPTSRSRRPLAYTAYLNESELCAMWMDVYDRATSRHKLILPKRPS